tara:strand:- start:2405 stop:3040 length:636 start_codon:yes stop_codon:yes gene_type:complete
MKLNIKSILKDKNVLRIVAFISLLNLLGYIMVRDMTSVVFFLLVGYLATYFSKNMIVILLVAMFTTNFFALSRRMPPKPYSKPIETFKGSSRANTVNYTAAPSSMDERLAGGTDNLNNNLDQAASLKSMISTLNNQMGPEGMAKMNSESDKLLKKHKTLQKQMSDVTPVLNESMKMLDGIGGIEGLNGTIDKIEGLLNKFGGGGILGGSKK